MEGTDLQGSQNLVTLTTFYKHQIKCLFCTDRQDFLENGLSVKRKTNNENACKFCAVEICSPERIEREITGQTTELQQC